jgi:imidazolonepropionase-like amidohydrolase
VPREVCEEFARHARAGVRRAASFGLAFALVLHVRAQDPAPAQPTAFVGARILTVSGPPIERGVLLVQGGRIAAIGEAASIELPTGTLVRDLGGLWLIPGLVCTHSHIGSAAGADASTPLQPEVRVLDAIDVRAASVHRARAGGITTVNVMPGSGHLLSGQTAYLKLRRGDGIDDLVIRDEQGVPCGGVKMANGTNSRGAAPFPGTRAKSAALVRERFLAAREHQAKLARAAEKAAQATGEAELPPARDLGLEVLIELLEGRRIVHHHTHRHDDILTALRLRDEFGLRMVLHHVSDAWQVPDEIARSGAPCSLILLDAPGGKLEARDIRWENAAALERAGVPVALHTDDWITDSRLFLRSAQLAVRGGMSREKALEALTLAGARMLDLESRVGSLEVGKDADFAILSGDPLSTYTHVLETWVEGARVFDRADPADRLIALGGFGAGEAHDGHSCCGPHEDGDS